MHLIADILSFNNNQEELTEHFNKTSIDWDAIVIIGSKHLMLPALYCNLKTKDLLQLIPEELQIYLEEITAINRGRNEILLKEAHEISNIFKKENIEHVFIKGIALIAGNTFEDIAERMIGDIDILVASDQLQTAFEILNQSGYEKTIAFNYETKNFRHLARQISRHKFGAIELHSDILIHKYRHLIIKEEVLKNKRIINGIAITSIEDSIKIAILGLQINDKAHILRLINFKTIYDYLSLNLFSNNVFRKNLCHDKHTYSFLLLSSVFFTDLTPDKSTIYSTFLKHYFIFGLRNPKLRHLAYTLLKAKLDIHERLTLLIGNKSYRMHIFKNIWLIKKD